MKTANKVNKSKKSNTKNFLSEEGKDFYFIINTHKNFMEEQFYKQFAKDIPAAAKVEIQPLF